MDIQEISPGQLKERLDSDKQLLVLHISDVKKFKNEHIPKTISAPAKNINILDELVHARDRELILYDEGLEDTNTAIAINKLQNMGYNNIKILAGGLKAWKEEGFKLHGRKHTASIN